MLSNMCVYAHIPSEAQECHTKGFILLKTKLTKSLLQWEKVDCRKARRMRCQTTANRSLEIERSQKKRSPEGGPFFYYKPQIS